MIYTCTFVYTYIRLVTTRLVAKFQMIFTQSPKFATWRVITVRWILRGLHLPRGNESSARHRGILFVKRCSSFLRPTILKNRSTRGCNARTSLRARTFDFIIESLNGRSATRRGGTIKQPGEGAKYLRETRDCLLRRGGGPKNARRESYRTFW